MAGDGLDLIGAASGVRKPRRGGLAQAVGRAMSRQSGFVAPRAQPSAEAIGREGLAVLADQERHVGLRRRRQCLRKLGMDLDQERRVGLLLTYRDGVALDVLPAEADHIAATLRRVEQQSKCQPRLAANGMPCLEADDFILCPTMESVALAPVGLHADRRIALDHSKVDGVVEYHAQNLKIISCVRSRRLGADNVLYMRPFKPR